MELRNGLHGGSQIAEFETEMGVGFIKQIFYPNITCT